MKYVVIQILLVLALVLVVFGLIILIWAMTRKRNGLKYEKILRDDFHIPIENGTLVRTLNVYAAKNAIKKLRKAKANFEATPSDEKYKVVYFGKKLKLFHLFSLFGCDNDQVIGELIGKAKLVEKTLSYNELRIDPEEQEITEDVPIASERDCESVLEEVGCLESRVKSYFDKATVATNIKTTNLWGRESAKKNRRVKDGLLEVLKALKNETENINSILSRIEEIISAVRLSFYRNQYLCSELMEYCSADSVKMKIFPDIHLIRSKPVLLSPYEASEDSNDIDIQISGFNMSFRLWLSKSNKDKIVTLKSEAKDILKAIEETVEDLRRRHSAVVQAINITKSLIDVNKKFVIQYIPLRTKVFVKGKSATSQELQALAQTVVQFNRFFVRE